jgi:hypothetical protein
MIGNRGAGPCGSEHGGEKGRFDRNACWLLDRSMAQLGCVPESPMDQSDRLLNQHSW